MKDIFLITSVINTGAEYWTYSYTRSAYGSDERFADTLKTIQSIREFSKDSMIVFVEGSKLDDIMKKTITAAVDIFIDASTISEVEQACLKSRKKGYGEIVKTSIALEVLRTHKIEFNRLFKISGRYYLNEKFDINRFSTSCYTFKSISTDVPGSEGSWTVLYSVPYALLDDFVKAVASCIQTYREVTSMALEIILPKKCNPQILIDTLGVSGYVAVDRTFYTA